MATMYGKSKRFRLNEVFKTAKGDIKFLRYIETEENQPKVEFINLTTNTVEIDYYGIVYYKVIKFHKKLGIPAPESVKYEYTVDFKRDLKFGVELELIVPSTVNIREKLSDAGVKISHPDRTHDVVSGWKLVYDGSIRAPRGFIGYELVSPPSTNFDDLKIVCNILKENGVKTNTSCGLHVHHDIHELKRQQIIRIYDFYNKYEKLIDAMHNKSRECNLYCKSIKSIIDKVRDCETKDELLVRVAGKGNTNYYNNVRYYKINLRSFLYYGTIEFRQAAGTIDFNEITSWIIFTHKIIERALQIGCNIEEMNEEELAEYEYKPITQLENMMKELGIYWLTETYKNLQKRIEKRSRRRVA